MSRKKRKDRNHVIYEIVNTTNGKSYLGVTACIGRRINYSVQLRFQKHCSRAKKEKKQKKNKGEKKSTNFFQLSISKNMESSASADSQFCADLECHLIVEKWISRAHIHTQSLCIFFWGCEIGRAHV